MLRKKKILTTALCAGGVVLSAVMAEDTTSEATTTADVLVSQPFESALTDVKTLTGDKAGTWEGYGSVTNQSVGTGYAKSVGKPISGTNETDKHKLYLSVDGYVTCTAATTENKPATVDMMIQIAKPDEALALPTGESTDGIQIAVGVDVTGLLKVYCTGKTTGTVAWYSLGETEYKEGEWHRVSFTFDYMNQTCQIRLDGEPLMTADGYLTSDPKGASAKIGSWYKLNTGATKLSSVKVVGSTAIDEVVIKQATTVTDALPVLADVGDDTEGVPNQWIAEQGITREQAKGDAPDNSGMTVEAKYLTGLPIGDGKTYAITAMKMEGEGKNLKATLTVPAMTPPEKVGETNVARQNVIVYGSDPDSLTKKQVIPSGATTVELTVKKVDSGVTKIYYQLKNEEKTDSAATN